MLYTWHYVSHAHLRGAYGNSVINPRLLVIAVLVSVWSARLTFNFWRKGGYSWATEDYRCASEQVVATPVWRFAVRWQSSSQRTCSLWIGCSQVGSYTAGKIVCPSLAAAHSRPPLYRSLPKRASDAPHAARVCLLAAPGNAASVNGRGRWPECCGIYHRRGHCRSAAVEFPGTMVEVTWWWQLPEGLTKLCCRCTVRETYKNEDQSTTDPRFQSRFPDDWAIQVQQTSKLLCGCGSCYYDRDKEGANEPRQGVCMFIILV